MINFFKKALAIGLAVVSMISVFPALTSNAATNSGWQQQYSTWYWINEDGSKYTGWKKVNGYWYYLSPSMYHNGVYKVNGKYYAFRDNGIMVTNGWFSSSGAWYYASSDGSLLNGWQKINKKWYYLNDFGGFSAPRAMTGPFSIMEDGLYTRYLFNSDGALTYGWCKVNNNWYYSDSNGVVCTGWQKINGVWYYFDTYYGTMYTGTVAIYNSKSGAYERFCFASTGAMQTGWAKHDGYWYYCASNGIACKGWKQINGKWYYFDTNNCRMAVGRHTIDGKVYNFDESGAWIR